jgi:hypothetical protein
MTSLSNVVELDTIMLGACTLGAFDTLDAFETCKAAFGNKGLALLLMVLAALEGVGLGDFFLDFGFNILLKNLSIWLYDLLQVGVAGACLLIASAWELGDHLGCADEGMMIKSNIGIVVPLSVHVTCDD